MSNEMISVPRELLERLLNAAEWQALDFDGSGSSFKVEIARTVAELRDLLAKPAAQLQGEPAGYKYRRKGKNRAWTYSSVGPEFAEEEFDILPLYTRPAEQPAPASAAILARLRLPERKDEEPYWSAELCPDGDQIQEWAEAAIWNACLDEVERAVLALYTRPAEQPAEAPEPEDFEKWFLEKFGQTFEHFHRMCLGIDGAPGINGSLSLERVRNDYARDMFKRAQPVAVVLPARPHASEEEQQGMTDYEIGLGHGACEMWDKIKLLNPGDKP